MMFKPQLLSIQMYGMQKLLSFINLESRDTLVCISI